MTSISSLHAFNSRLVSVFALWIFCTAAQALDLQVGNLAPGAGRVEIRVAGAAERTALAYLEFDRLATAGNSNRLEVSAVSSDSGEVLAHAVFELAPASGVEPALVFAGNGVDQVFALHLFQQVGDEVSSAITAPSEAAFGIHHLAAFAAARNEIGEYTIECTGSTPNGETSRFTAGGSALYFGSGRVERVDTQFAQNACALQVIDPLFGTFELSASVQSGQTLRMFLTGDGKREPFRLVAVIGAQIVAVAGESAPAPGAVLSAAAFWYDQARPAQGVTLYEIPESPDVFGTWFTHDSSGKPIWYSFDGIIGDLPGQRDLLVYRPARDPAMPQTLVGSARLYYLDCNQAELRVVLEPSDLRTLRIHRSRNVQACDALGKR
jgi:hypothetical protein